MFGDGRREIAGEEMDAGPSPADVRAGTQLFGLLKLHQRVGEIPAENLRGCGGEVIGPPIFDACKQRQVSPAAAAVRASGILGSTDGTAKGHDLFLTTDRTDGTDK
jgi:hypothetical protein